METITLMPVIEENIEFSWYDYVLFSLMLSISALIGVYFGFIKKQSTTNDYLLGGREMSVIPIASSLIASMISGITLLGVPTDIYSYGISYWFSILILCVGTMVTYWVYMPVFYELGVTSTNEYLLLRFDSTVRTFASAVFALSMFMYLPIVIYIPALALSQSTGVNINLITPAICGICVFYTTFGGLKAVVWTDALQFVVMIGSIIVVFFLGISTGGGFVTIWQKNLQYRRLDVSFNPDITVRDTFWAGSVGLGFTWFSYIACNQGFVQKCNALPNYKSVKRALVIFAVGMVFILTMSVSTGLIMFARYSGCDPLSAGKIKKADQLLPYYIMDVARTIPGLAGLFTSGIFSAALSTLSACINCLSATIYEDFISYYIKEGTSEKTISNYLKLLAVVIGTISTVLVYVIPYLGNLLPLAVSMSGVTCGALLGVFTCGILLPGVNSKGAFWGGIISLAAMSWMIFGAQYYNSIGVIKHNPLPLTTNGCYNSTSLLNITMTTPILNTVRNEPPFILYRVSFYYYILIGTIVMIAAGIIISKFTPQYNKPTNKKYFSPVIRSISENMDDPPEYNFLSQTSNTMELKKCDLLL